MTVARDSSISCYEEKSCRRETTDKFKIWSSRTRASRLLCPLYGSLFWSHGNFGLLSIYFLSSIVETEHDQFRSLFCLNGLISGRLSELPIIEYIVQHSWLGLERSWWQEKLKVMIRLRILLKTTSSFQLGFS